MLITDAEDRSVPAGAELRVAGSRRTIVLLVAAFVVGLIWVLAAGGIADVIGALLPERAKVRGLGTNFERFEMVAPTVVRRSGFVLMGAAAVGAVVEIATRHERVASFADVVAETRHRRWVRPATQVAIAAGTAVWYGWLAHPHNAYRSNARFHWVDYLTFDSDNYFYAAGRIPHLVFYDSPHLWHAINAGLVVLVVAWIANRLRLSWLASLGMCVTPALASNVLLFADSAEDVLLNMLLLLLLIAAMLAHRPTLVGLALSGVVLGRPSFIVLVACVPGAVVLHAVRECAGSWTNRIKLVDWRFAGLSLASMVVSTAVLQILFTVLGRRYMFTRGRVIDTGPLEDIHPTDVDGFMISAFSGTYTLHLLWVLPLTLLLGAFMSVWAARRYPTVDATAVYFCGLASVAIPFVHESQPLGYYNIRYLCYVWPFVFVMSWIAFARRQRHGPPSWIAGLVALLVLGTVVLPVDPIGTKRRIEERSETELLEFRREVDELVGDGNVIITFGGGSTENLLAYVIRDQRRKISRVAWDQVDDDDSVVITGRDEPIEGRTPVIQTDSLLIYGRE